MNDIPLEILFLILGVLILLSGLFSGSETGLMSLNRYRLRHLSKEGHKGAQKAENLLRRPDRIIGLILLGNNFVNILASAIATVIGMRLWGEAGIAIATGLLTFVILIFSEVTPKTLAALHPERIAFPAAYAYKPMLKIIYPLVWMVNLLSNNLLKLFGVNTANLEAQSMSREELKTVVGEDNDQLDDSYKKMLTAVLDLEHVTVEDIMTARGEIETIDIDTPWDNILGQITNAPHSRMPVCEGNIDNTVGYVRMRTLLEPLRAGDLDEKTFRQHLSEPHYIPEGTSLNTQLLNFQHTGRRIGLVVDEYGDIQGLVTLEDILEEIVGTYTQDSVEEEFEIIHRADGSWQLEGQMPIREINQALETTFNTDGPKTFSGLITEALESIPSKGTALELDGFIIEILEMNATVVKTANLIPPKKQPDGENKD